MHLYPLVEPVRFYTRSFPCDIPFPTMISYVCLFVCLSESAVCLSDCLFPKRDGCHPNPNAYANANPKTLTRTRTRARARTLTPRTPRFVLLSGHDLGPMAPVLAALRMGGRDFRASCTGATGQSRRAGLVSLPLTLTLTLSLTSTLTLSP